MVSVATGNPKLQTLKRPPTMGYQFRVSPSNYTCNNYQIHTHTLFQSSVAQLMKNLLTKNPNYIRCIKVYTGKLKLQKS